MLPIRLLFETWCKELELSQAGIVGRLGYKNQAKALRRLDQILVGDFMTLGAIAGPARLSREFRENTFAGMGHLDRLG
jgi:hypothetical protein